MFDVLAMALDGLTLRLSECAIWVLPRPEPNKKKDVRLAVGQFFNANRRTRRALLLFRSRLERFFECAHRYVVADIDVPAQNFANRSEQLFLFFIT